MAATAPRLTLTLDLTDDAVVLIRKEIASAFEKYEGTPWLTTKEAAEYLRCPESRMYDLVAQDRVMVHRNGTRLRFRRADLDRFMEGTVR